MVSLMKSFSDGEHLTGRLVDEFKDHVKTEKKSGRLLDYCLKHFFYLGKSGELTVYLGGGRTESYEQLPQLGKEDYDRLVKLHCSKNTYNKFVEYYKNK